MPWLDVFLTTMKPQQKVVTAQDIESSLYYVHVDNERDAELLRSEEDIGSFTAQVRTNVVHRKPVLPPRRPTQEPESRPEAHSMSQPPLRPPQVSAMPVRKPGGHGNKNSNHESTGSSAIFALPKMYGPRPMHDRFHSVGSTVLENAPERRNIDTRKWTEQPVSLRPQLPPRPYEQKIRDLDQIYDANTIYSNERPPSMEDYRLNVQNESFDILSGRLPASDLSSLTLIRRYDYLQSNVGKILSSHLPGDPLKLDLTGPGYSKFNADEDGNIGKTSFEEQEQAVYRCQLHTVTNPSRPDHDPRTVSHDFSSVHKSRLRKGLDLRKRSPLRSNGFESTSNPKSASTKGYTFQSPWNGTCNFVTGVAGRSLRCVHSHPSRYGQAIEVSELRFNLPSSKAFVSAPKSLTPGTPRDSKRSSIFSNNHRRQDSFESFDNSSAASNIDLEDRLDLSLGQEHAGGGFGGKHAKLGKLIIEQDGLQMLDLVVAANMALWWRVYDRMV